MVLLPLLKDYLRFIMTDNPKQLLNFFPLDICTAAGRRGNFVIFGKVLRQLCCLTMVTSFLMIPFYYALAYKTHNGQK